MPSIFINWSCGKCLGARADHSGGSMFSMRTMYFFNHLFIMLLNWSNRSSSNRQICSYVVLQIFWYTYGYLKILNSINYYVVCILGRNFDYSQTFEDSSILAENTTHLKYGSWGRERMKIQTATLNLVTNLYNHPPPPPQSQKEKIKRIVSFSSSGGRECLTPNIDRYIYRD